MSVGQSAKSERRVGRGRGFLRLMTLAACMALGSAVCKAEDRAVKTRVAPLYPEIAKRLHVTGVVKLEVTVDADGKVTAVKTISGHQSLAPAAEDAVHKWKFASAPSETKENIEVNFSVNE